MCMDPTLFSAMLLQAYRRYKIVSFTLHYKTHYMACNPYVSVQP